MQYSQRSTRRTRTRKSRHHASAKGHIIGHVPPARDGMLRYVTKAGAVYETAAHRGGSRRAGSVRRKSSRKGKSSRRTR